MALPCSRPLRPDDYEQWRWLYQGYAEFYNTASTKDGVQTTWSWLIDAGHVYNGLVAEQQGRSVGLAHFRGMLNSLRRQMIGCLDGLFVLPDHLSDGAAAALIRAVQTKAKAQGWAVVHRITRDYNYRATGLYYKLAEKTEGVRYEMT